MTNFAAPLVRAMRRVPYDVVDGAPAAAFLAAMLIERTAWADLPPDRQPVAVALSVVVAGGLAARRRAPLAAYLAGSAALIAEALWMAPSPVSPYANFIGVYSLGLYGTRRRARWGPLLVVPGVLAYFSGFSGAGNSWGESAGVLFAWWLAWAVGYGTARRREEQEAARQATRRWAEAEERARIARELHDLIGHTVNVMVVQAGAGRLVLDRDTAKTREILTSLEHTGRQALSELDRVLGVLRHDAEGRDGDGPGPRPGMADLPRLAERMAEAGIEVTLRIDPSRPNVAQSMDLSAYRIIQEALTNALKHGDARSARVTVRHDGRILDTEVCDDGRGAPAGCLPGRGLLGIAERVTAFGGSLDHGAGERGGSGYGRCSPIT